MKLPLVLGLKWVCLVIGLTLALSFVFPPSTVNQSPCLFYYSGNEAGVEET